MWPSVLVTTSGDIATRERFVKDFYRQYSKWQCLVETTCCWEKYFWLRHKNRVIITPYRLSCTITALLVQFSNKNWFFHEITTHTKQWHFAFSWINPEISEPQMRQFCVLTSLASSLKMILFTSCCSRIHLVNSV